MSIDVHSIVGTGTGTVGTYLHFCKILSGRIEKVNKMAEGATELRTKKKSRCLN